VVLQVGVLRAVAAGRRAEAGRIGLSSEIRAGVDHDGRGGRAVLERGDVVEHLERRAGLTDADAGDVELALNTRIVAVVVVDGPDIRQDLAGSRVDGHERGVPYVAAVQLLDPLLHLPLADLLLRHVQRRRHAVTTTRDRRLVAAEDLRELVSHLKHEVRGLDRCHRRARDLDRLGVRAVGRGLLDRARVDHLAQNVGATVFGAVDVVGLRWVEDRGRLRQACEKRRLGERELR